MRSHIPIPSLEDRFIDGSKTEHIEIEYATDDASENKILICDAYVWKAPDNTTICTSLILPCPHCEYPIVIKPDQLALTFEASGITLNQKVSCPSRWKVMDGDVIDTDEDGTPITKRCGWSCKGIQHSKIRRNHG
jgi:hypothetical protein